MTKREKKFIRQINLWVILHNVNSSRDYYYLPRCENCIDWNNNCGYYDTEANKYRKETKAIPYSSNQDIPINFKFGHKPPAYWFCHACPEIFKKMKRLPNE